LIPGIDDTIQGVWDVVQTKVPIYGDIWSIDLESSHGTLRLDVVNVIHRLDSNGNKVYIEGKSAVNYTDNTFNYLGATIDDSTRIVVEKGFLNMFEDLMLPNTNGAATLMKGSTTHLDEGKYSIFVSC